MRNGIIENRKKYEKHDHIAGICNWCHKQVMFSESLDEIIDGHVVRFHKECYDEHCRLK
ncbi:hypothetical protein ES702_04092 [subsurface metagenome]